MRRRRERQKFVVERDDARPVRRPGRRGHGVTLRDQGLKNVRAAISRRSQHRAAAVEYRHRADIALDWRPPAAPPAGQLTESSGGLCADTVAKLRHTTSLSLA